jgi:hypothetical protein
MRILLDESLPRDLGKEIAGHEVTTVQQAGWTGLENGVAASNRIEALRPLIPELLQALAGIAGPKFVRIPAPK